MKRHRVLTEEQVAYDPSGDRAVPFEEGLDRLHAEGWALVTSYTGRAYGDAPITFFVFRTIREGTS